MNFGVAVPTTKVYSTMDQLLASWRGSGDSNCKEDTHVHQHPPSGNDQPDDSGYVSPTDSEFDDETRIANDQSAAVQLNPDAHEFKPQNYQHSNQNPTIATRPEEKLDLPKDKKSASVSSETPQENSRVSVETPQKEVSTKEDEDLVMESYLALHKQFSQLKRERKVRFTDVPHLEKVGLSIEDVHYILPKYVISRLTPRPFPASIWGKAVKQMRPYLNLDLIQWMMKKILPSFTKSNESRQKVKFQCTAGHARLSTLTVGGCQIQRHIKETQKKREA